jgi:hypothetical protein
VVGASGSGKSSVVRAGLVPELRRRRGAEMASTGSQVWEVATLVPGDRPLYALAATLAPPLEPDMPETDRLIAIRRQARALQDRDLALRDIVERVLAKQPGTDRLLLVADQWEELYTLTTDDAARRRFIDELLEASSAAPLSVVLTLRGDFVGRALAHRPLFDRLQDAQVNLGPMTRAELERAITKPAEKVGLGFEQGLVERILDDVGDEPGNLPLLEFVLKRLWEDRKGGQLLHEAYKSMRFLQGVIATKAEDLFGKLSQDEQQAARRVFLELVRPGRGAEDTRRRASLADIGEGALAVVRRLADERLLVTAPGETVTAEQGPEKVRENVHAEVDAKAGGNVDEKAQSPRTAEGENDGAVETVEVAHEALIRHWQRLKAWVDGDREFLLWRERFRALLAEWQRRGRDPGVLLPPALLLEAERWLGERGDTLSADERAYIGEGVALRERERRAEEERLRVDQERREREIRTRSARRTLALVLGAVVLAVLATLGVSTARRESSRKALVSDLAGEAPSNPAHKWVRIPAPAGGEFQMGCVPDDRQCFRDEKRHAARLSRDFQIMPHEVTAGGSTTRSRRSSGRCSGRDAPACWSRRTGARATTPSCLSPGTTRGSSASSSAPVFPPRWSGSMPPGAAAPTRSIPGETNTRTTRPTARGSAVGMSGRRARPSGSSSRIGASSTT